MGDTCPSCGYQPIGPYIDNCPICAEPVRNIGDDDQATSQAAAPTNFPPALIIGWIAIGIAILYFFAGDMPWLLLSGALCGGAWWGVRRGETLFLRLLGGSLLILFLPGIWLAGQPGILPGLDQRASSPERMMGELMEVVQGTSPETLRTRARLKTVSGTIYALHALVIIPLALLMPPLLSNRRRAAFGAPIHLSKPLAATGLAAWLGLLVLVGWLAWPTMQSWAEAPLPHVNWPPQPWPAAMPQPADPDE